MAVSAFLFTKYLASIHGGITAAETRQIDFLSDTIKGMLATVTWVPLRDTHQFKSDVTNEVVGAGYTAGGATLANKTVVVDGATHSVRLDGDDLSWPAATFTARYCVLYDDRAALASDKELIGYIDFGQNESVAGATFTVQFAAEGIVKHVAS